MKSSLRLALFFFFLLNACSLQTSAAAPPTLVMVTVPPDASPTPTPFQPVSGILVPSEAVTLIPSFTPEPPTNTPPPTLQFTATSLPPPIAAPTSARTHYTMH